MHQRQQRGGALAAGNEVGRDQQHLAVHAAEVGGQPRLQPAAAAGGLRLQRRVGRHHDVRAPVRRQFVVAQSLCGGRGGDPFQVDLCRGVGGFVGERGHQLVQVFRRLRVQRLDRHRRAGVPEIVEDRAGVGHRRAEQEHVEVAEVHAASGVEVFVADVAAADQRDPAVDDPRLVVHAVVDAEETLHHFQQAPHAAAVAERVVQPHLDVRVRVQRQQRRVEPLGIDVVEQQAHAHATLGRGVHLARQQVADQVVVPHVVLQVQAAPGQACRGGARGERVQAVGQQGRRGLAGVRGQVRRQFAVDRRLCRLQRQRRAGRTGGAWGQAVGQQQSAEHEQQQRQHASTQPDRHPAHPWHLLRPIIRLLPRLMQRPAADGGRPLGSMACRRPACRVAAAY